MISLHKEGVNWAESWKRGQGKSEKAQKQYYTKSYITETDEVLGIQREET